MGRPRTNTLAVNPWQRGSVPDWYFRSWAKQV